MGNSVHAGRLKAMRERERLLTKVVVGEHPWARKRRAAYVRKCVDLGVEPKPPREEK